MHHDVISNKAGPALLYALQYSMVPVLEYQYCYVQDG